MKEIVAESLDAMLAEAEIDESLHRRLSIAPFTVENLRRLSGVPPASKNEPIGSEEVIVALRKYVDILQSESIVEETKEEHADVDKVFAIEDVAQFLDSLEEEKFQVAPSIANEDPIAVAPLPAHRRRGTLEVVVTSPNPSAPRRSSRLNVYPMQELITDALMDSQIHRALVSVRGAIVFDDHVKYQVFLQIFPKIGRSADAEVQMMLLRRYSQFESLQKAATSVLANKSEASGIASKLAWSFPGKQWVSLWGCWANEWHLSSRQKSLETWMNILLDHHVDIVAHDDGEYEEALKTFLLN